MITYMQGSPKESKAVGLCHYLKHYGYLSKDMMKKHDCLGKQCPHFEKFEEHDFWEKKAVRQEFRKTAKERRALAQSQGIKKKKTVSMVKTPGKTVFRDKEPINDAFAGLSGMFGDLTTYTAYSIICLMHERNEFGEREPYPVIEASDKYYSLEDALAGIMKRNGRKSLSELKTDYLLVSDDKGQHRGYRIDNQRNEYHEIDLSWGNLYPLLEKRVAYAV